MYMGSPQTYYAWSTSVWGSELKYVVYRTASDKERRLPLCEVVSWNSNSDIAITGYTRLPLCEVVSWNAFLLHTSYWCTRLPLCEVVSWNNHKRDSVVGKISLPLCEVVSWNVLKIKRKVILWESTSVWGSELNVFEGSMWYCRFNPMMGKSVPQIFWACCTYSRSVVPERITVLI